MAFEACVEQILCSLTAPVLRGIKATIAGAVIAIDAQLALLAVLELKAELALLPLLPVKLAIEAAVKQLGSMSVLLPLNLVQGCVDLGSVNVSLSGLFPNLTASPARISDALAKVKRAEAGLGVIKASRAELSATKATLDDFDATLDTCITRVEAES